MNVDHFDRVIRNCHESSMNPDTWPETLIDLSDSFKLPVMHLLLRTADNEGAYVGLIPRSNPEIDQEYFDHYAEIDPRLPLVRRMPIGMPYRDRNLLSPDQLKQSAVFQEFHVKHGAYNFAGSNLSIENCFGYFGIASDRADKDFDDIQLEVFKRLVPHLLIALRTQKANSDIGLTRDASLFALDHVKNPIFLFVDGLLEYYNIEAANVIDSGFLSVSNGMIKCTDKQQKYKLKDLIVNEFNTINSSVLLSDTINNKFYICNLHDPMPSLLSSKLRGSRYRILTLVQTINCIRKTENEIRNICSEFSVTVSESAVIYGIIENRSLAEIAKIRSVTLNTVQKQLKSAMHKMNLNSQKQLISMFDRI